MPDPFYPTIDLQFIEDQLKITGNFEGFFMVGSTATFMLPGTKAIHKRMIVVRQIEPGKVCYEQATGLAARFKFIGPLMNWLEEHRNWKEGAYIEK